MIVYCMTSDYPAYEPILNKQLRLCLIPVCIWFLVLRISQLRYINCTLL